MRPELPTLDEELPTQPPAPDPVMGALETVLKELQEIKKQQILMAKAISDIGHEVQRLALRPSSSSSLRAVAP